MLTSCLAADKVRAYLADELPPEEEGDLSRHVESCPQCQGLIEKLSDDAPTRELQAEHRRHAAAAKDGTAPQLDEVRERLHVLGWFSAATVEGGGSTVAARDQAAPSTGPSPAPSSAAAAAAVTCVGKFQIIQPIGAGGFGVVYLARDQVLHRQVALKLARSNVLADPDLKDRFLREAQALARLEHPNIVRVYEAGEHDGACYLAVAYCDGPTLEQWLRERPGGIEPRLAARLALTLAEAVEHAHQHGILHRDVKPSNILLELPAAGAGTGAESVPVPKLTDFGLAKIAEQESITTLSGTLLGTPQYMAPEQAAGLHQRIGPATDVYSLGAVLYELLVGQPPIRGATAVDTLRRVLIDEPPPPQQASPAVSDDLNAIVLKCLDKSPSRRYASAADLAADLRRFLENRPTIARPLTRGQRTLRWIARHPAASLVTGLVALVLLLAGGMFFFNRQLVHLRQEVERQNAVATYRDDIRAAAAHIADGDVARAEELLRRYLPAGDAAGAGDLRSLEWHYLWSQIAHDAYAEYEAGSSVYQARLSPDGKQLALACQDGSLRLLDAQTLAEIAVLRTPQLELNGLAWSSDGRLIATAFDDGVVRIWNVKERGRPLEMRVHDKKVFGVAFYDGDARLVTCGEEPVVRLWDLATGQPLGTLKGHLRAVEALAISPTENLLATAGSDRRALLWDLDTREQVGELADHKGRLSSVAFSPDGQWLATGGIDAAVCLWSVAEQKRVARAYSLDGVQSVVFTSDGQRLVIGDRGGALRNYRMQPQQPPLAGMELVLETADQAWHSHAGKVWALAALPDGQRFVSGGGGGKVRAWGRGHKVLRHWNVDPDRFEACGYSRDAVQLFTLRYQAGVELYDTMALQPTFILPADEVLAPSPAGGRRYGTLALLPGREQVAVGTKTGEVLVWNWRSKTMLHRWPIVEDAWIDQLVYSPAAHLLAVLAYSREDVLLIDPDTGETVASLPAPSCTDAAFSPDGRRLVVDTLNSLRIYDLRTFGLLHTAGGHTDTVESLAYSPDGRYIASGSADRSVRLWTADGRAVAVLGNHRKCVRAVAFTPDGRSLVSGDEEGRLKIFHVATQRLLLEIDSGLTDVRRLAVSPDSQRLVATGEQRDIVVIGPALRQEEE